jgi:RHS repeat-associated protein
VFVPRFLYTGQRYFGGVGLYYYKARFYDPKLGRFLQPDPIGYGDGMNMYAYVGGDPVNGTDPSGLCRDENGDWFDAPTGSRICEGHGSASAYGGIAGHTSGFSSAGAGGAGGPTFGEAYAAARELAGGYGSSAVNAAADYFMGQGSFGGAARQILGSACPGQYNCADKATSAQARELSELYKNEAFANAVRYAALKSMRTGNEWGFTGKGRADFRQIGGFIQGGKDAISSQIIAQRAAMGADLFFHIHPNSGPKYGPGLSYGRQVMVYGGDLGIAYFNNMLVGAYAFSSNKLYWFDGRGMRR